MTRLLLDAAAYIDVQRARKHRREPWAIHTLRQLSVNTIKHGKPGLSTLTVMEIVAGFEEERRATQLKHFLEEVLPTFEIIGFGTPEACLTGEIYAKLEDRRQRIGFADTGVAATASLHALTVVTSNTKHFQRIIDLGYPLKLENWREA